MINAKIYPGTPRGTVKIPASKSLAHRAIICAALADGESRLYGLSEKELSDDIRATVAAMQKLGADIRFVDDALIIHGGRPHPKAAAGRECRINCGESGSTLRFIIPIAALADTPVCLHAEGRLPERPQTVYQKIFAEQGLCFKQTPKNDGWLLRGPLAPGSFCLHGDVSSQFISGLLFALPLLKESSTINILPPFESRSYVELTLQTLGQFGIRAFWQDEHTLHIPGGQSYRPAEQTIEGDFSQMAFFAVLGAINSEITVAGVNPLSAQGDKKIVEIIRRMNGCITETAEGYIVKPGRLCAADIDLADCPDLGPALAVLAACADGETRLYNAGRLRIKESDRIADVEAELKNLGISARSTETELFITGGAPTDAAPPCQCHNDHRIVMALAVLATAGSRPLTLIGASAVNKSYPRFFEDLQNLGIKVELENAD